MQVSIYVNFQELTPDEQMRPEMNRFVLYLGLMVFLLITTEVEAKDFDIELFCKRFDSALWALSNEYANGDKWKNNENTRPYIERIAILVLYACEYSSGEPQVINRGESLKKFGHINVPLIYHFPDERRFLYQIHGLFPKESKLYKDRNDHDRGMYMFVYKALSILKKEKQPENAIRE